MRIARWAWVVGICALCLLPVAIDLLWDLR